MELKVFSLPAQLIDKNKWKPDRILWDEIVGASSYVQFIYGGCVYMTLCVCVKWFQYLKRLKKVS